jgi:hypothetical protein
MIEQKWRTDLEEVTEQQTKRCRCAQPMSEQNFAARTISTVAVNLPATEPQRDAREQPMHVVVLSAAKVAVPVRGTP